MRFQIFWILTTIFDVNRKFQFFLFFLFFKKNILEVLKHFSVAFLYNIIYDHAASAE